ncbi:hypothetical protein M0802_010874 [Mischocyttarus mexicanus]|nr:hypothetical protein M0802_010874 [Mischocyttarus mexicanus]
MLFALETYCENSPRHIPLSLTSENEPGTRHILGLLVRSSKTVENIRGPCRLINASDSTAKPIGAPGQCHLHSDPTRENKNDRDRT